MDRLRGLAGDAKDGGGNGERLILGEFIGFADVVCGSCDPGIPICALIDNERDFEAEFIIPL